MAAGVARILVHRRWESRVSKVCFAAPEISQHLPVVLSNAKWKMSQAGVDQFREFPEPDAIIVRNDSVALVWQPPLLSWEPKSMRMGSEAYALDFVFAPDGTVTSDCHHGSD
jgi:hypothetical protein